MAKSEGPVTIKKYANRRLYNTGTSTYVTLEDLAAMVKAGEDFIVHDAKTGEDITRQVLAQIIFEQENKEGQSLLPIGFLRQPFWRARGPSAAEHGNVRTCLCHVHSIRTARGTIPGRGGQGQFTAERQQRRDPRSQAADGRDAEASRSAERQGQDLTPSRLDAR